ncbi:WYL domain-containing protein [Phyllobacterium sp. LjRoot231]|uniref:WYL domain-containing protein n=1 Tax=Phyllobacterium sp. LjRoot231 TaxID=3342289 RepID=UPI003ECECF7A
MTGHISICEAIRQRKLIRFTYDDHVRTVEPHLAGYDSNRDLTLSAWQLSGGNGEGWRAFHISKITALTITGHSFEGTRQGYNPRDPRIPQVICHL